MHFTPQGTVHGGNHKLLMDEACITVSDANDSLLFYSDGTAIFNRKDVVMDKGWALRSGTSSTQGISFLELDSGYYLFFTVDDCGTDGQLSYGLLNIYFNGGDGEVLKKNQFLADSMDEKQVLIDDGSNTYLVSTDRKMEYLYIYSIDKINRQIHFFEKVPTGLVKNRVCAGQMRVSPNGKMLTMVEPLNHNGLVHLFCIESSPFTIKYFGSINTLNPCTYFAYGVEFSPDCSKLYITDDDNIYQYDLSSRDIDSINQSKYVVYGPVNAQDSGFGGLQLGPDKRIYTISGIGNPYLSKIEAPNLKGSKCNFIYLSDTIPNCSCYSNLPYFQTQYLNADTDFQMTLKCIDKVEDTSYFTMPNVFTANDDNINDCFAYDYKNIDDFYITIYNRWGEIVYRSIDINEFWCGKAMSGNQSPAGTYYCIVSYTSKGMNVVKKQTITLIR